MYAVGFVDWVTDTPRIEKSIYFGIFVYKGIPRLAGLVYNSNYFVLFDSIFFFYFLSHMKKRVHTIGLVLTGTAILLTVSIGGIGAVFVPFVLNFFLERDGCSRRKTLMIFAAAVAVFAVLYAAVLKDTNFLSYRLESLKTGSYRYDMWRYALSLFKETPLTGIGLYNFRHFSRNLFHIMNMHNTWLKTLVEGGIIGFVLFAWFNFLALRRIVEAFRRDDSARYLFLTYISVLLVFLSLSALIHEFYFLVLALISRYGEEHTLTWKEPRSGE
jgi:O-antigen ligase